MNEILQKRIEEAANKICCTDCPFGSIRNCKECVEKENAIKTATFALRQQWIPVEEALPEDKTKVFVIVKTPVGIVHRADYHINDYWYMSRYSPEEIVTHWMPIPIVEGGEK